VASAQTKASNDQLAAATELLLAMQLDKTTGPAIENTVDMQIKANPSMARNRKVMLEFLTKHMGWEAIKDEIAQIYAEEFTLQEMKEITAFYRTPNGRRWAERFPQLMLRGGEMGMRRVQAHLPELQALLAKEPNPE